MLLKTLGYISLSITGLGAWLYNINKDDVLFVITVVSGLSATLSFIVKTIRDYKEMNKK